MECEDASDCMVDMEALIQLIDEKEAELEQANAMAAAPAALLEPQLKGPRARVSQGVAFQCELFVRACEDAVFAVDLQPPEPRPQNRMAVGALLGLRMWAPANNYERALALGMAEPPGIYKRCPHGGMVAASDGPFGVAWNKLPCFELDHDYVPYMNLGSAAPSFVLSRDGDADPKKLIAMLLCYSSASGNVIAGLDLTKFGYASVSSGHAATLVVSWSLTGAMMPLGHERGIYLFRLAVGDPLVLYGLAARLPQHTMSSAFAATPAFRVVKKNNALKGRGFVSRVLANRIGALYEKTIGDGRAYMRPAPADKEGALVEGNGDA